MKLLCSEAAFLSTDTSSQVFTADAAYVSSVLVPTLFSKVGCDVSDDAGSM
jgi:hypothetical protein